MGAPKRLGISDWITAKIVDFRCDFADSDAGLVSCHRVLSLLVGAA